MRGKVTSRIAKPRVHGGESRASCRRDLRSGHQLELGQYEDFATILIELSEDLEQHLELMRLLERTLLTLDSRISNRIEIGRIANVSALNRLFELNCDISQDAEQPRAR